MYYFLSISYIHIENQLLRERTETLDKELQKANKVWFENFVL